MQSSEETVEEVRLKQLIAALREAQTARAVLRFIEEQPLRGAMAARLHFLAREMRADADEKVVSLVELIRAEGT